MSQYTPGPWTMERTNWRGESSGHKIYISGNQHECYDDDDDPDDPDDLPTTVATAICIVEGNATSQGVTEANARLIAAAPDFLRGIDLMMANEQCGGDGWWKGYDMLKAAHAKAMKHP